MAKGWTVEGIVPNQLTIESARCIILAKFCEAISYKEELLTKGDPDSVHDMRVSLRRLWAAMRNFEDLFRDEPGFRKLAKQTRRMARKLGKVRDTDVLIELMEKQKAEGENIEEFVLELLIARCQNRRKKAYKKLLDSIQKLEKRNFETDFIGFFANSHILVEQVTLYNNRKKKTENQNKELENYSTDFRSIGSENF
ncbi:MAG: CHAD domain-containing protein [Blastocatellia bacterium]|nr:CHAD domain-containing protein [Blastocatellia bacterium]